MKHISFIFSDKKEYKKAQKNYNKKKYKSKLIQIFSGIREKKKIKNILKKLSKDFPDAIIIGATTAGEISHAKMYNESVVVSLSLFENTTLKVDYEENIDQISAKRLSNNIYDKHTKAAIILSEGLNGEDYEGFIREINYQYPDVIVAGGLAGDNFLLKKSYIFLGANVYDKGVVAVSFSGKKLLAQNIYNLNWIPIGKEFKITKAEGNIVKEIDGIEATQFFKKYLGENIFKNSAFTLLNFQLLYKVGTTIVARTPMAIKNNHLIFAAPIKEGQTVQFGFSNASNIITGANSLAYEIGKYKIDGIYIYSCIARKTLIGKELENEFNSFEEIAPTAGFFTYGEFYSTSDKNALLNCTTTLLALSENPKISKKRKLKVVKDNLENATFNALSHLITQTSIELKANTELLDQYKKAVDASMIVSKTDKNGIITYVNDNFCKISKYSSKELIGNNHNVIRDKDVSDYIFKKLWNTILNGKVWKGVLSNIAKDGNKYYVDATILPIFDKNKNIKEFIAIRQDITKHIKSQNRIKEKERFIKAIFDNQDSIVLISSKERGVISANKKLFDFLDFKDFNDFKKNHECICDLFIEQDGYIYKSKYPDWQDYITNNRDKEHKAKILTKDGVVRTFKLVGNKFGNEYIVNLYDITELEDAINRAYASEQAKSQFLSNMSHEIRTPLNGILGFTDILLKKDLNEDIRKYINIIHKSGETLLNIVNDILDFSKIESGELSLYETDSNLFEETEASISTFAFLAKQKHIEYSTYINPNMPKLLKCDSQRIKQVLNNLISNAMKFTPEGGNVWVNIDIVKQTDSEAYIKFSVKDSGIGIPKEKIATIFKPFSQADNSISRRFGGTGLGLAISNRYIEMMGSKIEVKSEEGKGSEFYFTLKLPISDKQKAIEESDNKNRIDNLNISLLYSKDNIVCNANKNISMYLDNWNIDYIKIDTLEAINENSNVVIICSKLFDKEKCIHLLDSFEKLHIIYIEGPEDDFNCTHEKFHLVEQPITASSLFDTLIGLIHQKNSYKTENSSSHDSTTKHFKGNVLIAEDNETNQMLISVLLDERGLNYKIVNNGQEAIDEVSKNDIYDLILMDINMPVLDGVKATKILRENGYKKPIVSLSANVIEADRKSFIEAGIDSTLNKPIIPEELDQTLNRYLSSKSKREKKEDIEFDRVDVDLISNSLSIKNRDIILRLLKTFVSSAKDILNRLNEDGLDKDLAHKIKGMAGNLRFNNLYKFSSKVENDLINGNFNDLYIKRDKIIKHLENLIEQIESL